MFRLRREERTAYPILVPVLLIIAVFVYFPALLTFWRSFNAVSLGLNANEHFVGVGNYAKLLTPGSGFWTSFWITAQIVLITLPLELIVGTAGALLLNHKFRGRGVARVIAFLPWMLPPIVVGFMWNWVLNGDFGALNGLLYQLGIIQEYQYWLQQPSSQLVWVAVAQSWTRYGFVLLVLLAGLQSIGLEIYDAAKVDGAGSVATFRRITFPHLLPTFTIVLAIELITSIQVFDLVWSITSGGGAGGQINPFTKVLMVQDYQVVFRNLDLGMGGALSYLILLVSLGGAFFFVRNLYQRVTL